MAMRILVADDDPLLVELIEFKLTSRGYDVLTASDGESALASCIAQHPDLLVLDAMMPVLDGYEVLRRLREDGRTRSIPVIMLTARRTESDVLSGLALGARDYLVKPFIPEELVARIGKVLAGEVRTPHES
jgi:DNA-binding response OmpR family regulator